MLVSDWLLPLNCHFYTTYAVTFSLGQMLTRDLFGLGNLCYGYYCVLEYDHVHVVVDNARPFMSGTLD